jgi:hypothetical protein
MIKGGVGPPEVEKHILPKWVYQKYKTWNTYTEPLQPNSLEKQIGHNHP